MGECLASIQKGLSSGSAALKTIKPKPGIYKSKHSYNSGGRHLTLLMNAFLR